MKSCITCKHRHVYLEKAAKTRPIERIDEKTGEVSYETEEYEVKAILLPRCLKDKVAAKKPHPFGIGESGPVLTCREMLLNGCRNFNLWEPIGENKHGKPNSRVARTDQRTRHSGSPKPDQRLREREAGATT